MVLDNDCKYNLFKCKLTKKEEREEVKEEEEEEKEETGNNNNRENMMDSAMHSVSQIGERVVKQLSKMGLSSEESGLYDVFLKY